MKTPERIHFHKSFNFDQLPSGSSDINIHKDDIEYIRKDIVKKLIDWLLGHYDFPERQPGEGAYWWRKELARKAARLFGIQITKNTKDEPVFTKEQVIEFIKKGMMLKSIDIFNKLLNDDLTAPLKEMDETWIENNIIKPFDSK